MNINVTKYNIIQLTNKSSVSIGLSPVLNIRLATVILTIPSSWRKRDSACVIENYSDHAIVVLCVSEFHVATCILCSPSCTSYNYIAIIDIHYYIHVIVIWAAIILQYSQSCRMHVLVLFMFFLSCSQCMFIISCTADNIMLVCLLYCQEEAQFDRAVDLTFWSWFVMSWYQTTNLLSTSFIFKLAICTKLS